MFEDKIIRTQNILVDCLPMQKLKSREVKSSCFSHESIGESTDSILSERLMYLPVPGHLLLPAAEETN